MQDNNQETAVSGYRLLFIDDSKTHLIFAKIFCDKIHADAVYETSAREGIRRVIQGQLDMAFIDLQMPEMSGIEVMTKIRKLRPALKMAIVTAYGKSLPTGVDPRELAKADALVMKPYSKETLEKCLRIVLEENKRYACKEFIRSNEVFQNFAAA